MAQIAEVLEYVAYANGRGQTFEFRDFEAEDLRSPKALRNGTIVFPVGWAADKRDRWRRRHHLRIPEALSRLRAVEGRHTYTERD